MKAYIRPEGIAEIQVKTLLLDYAVIIIYHDSVFISTIIKKGENIIILANFILS